jgi:hypothetical protein
MKNEMKKIAFHVLGLTVTENQLIDFKNPFS